MALIVQKFGGTSVGSIERIRNVARRALECQANGDQIVVVVSAMSGETNRLIGLAKEINPVPFSREYDMLVASGEQVSVGLVSLAINSEAQAMGLRPAAGYKSRPLLGYQLGFRTNSVFSKARIQSIDTTLLRAELGKGVIPVIAGFQGVDPENNITTLGRGGSDTSAVAIAAALDADVCDIYTDVDGVYTTDPRLYPGARKIKRISYEEMMELASLGAKVLQIRSVELAAKYGVPVHVRSSFDHSEGTLVVSKEKLGGEMEQVVVAGVAADMEQVLLTVQNIPATAGVAARIFGALSEAAVSVDVIVQDMPAKGRLTLSFTVGAADAGKAREILDPLLSAEYPGANVFEQNDLAKVSIVGVGMAHHPGVASKMFQLLAQAGIDIKLISTSEIKISCLVEREKAKEAVGCLHRGFQLDLVE